MGERDEKKFIDFVKANGCTVYKKVLFDGETPQTLYGCTDPYSTAYYIASADFDVSDSYISSEENGKNVMVLFPFSDNLYSRALPLIEFSRGRVNIFPGRLYVNVDTMEKNDKEFVKKKMDLFRKWIKENATFVYRFGTEKFYFTQDATEEFKNKQ